MFDDFRQNVKKLAKEKNLTYAQIAEAAGIEESTIKSFMCGANDSRRVAEKLSDVFEIEIIYSKGKYKISERSENIMVKIKEENGELVFTVEKPDKVDEKSRIIRISTDAMRALDKIKAETGLSTARIATELILFAKDHYSVKVET